MKRKDGKKEGKRRWDRRMSDDHSDVGAWEEREANPGNVTGDGEVELNLPREVMEEQDQSREDIRESPGATASGATAMSREERLELPNGARPKWSRRGLPRPTMEVPRDPVMRTMADVGGSGEDRGGTGIPAPFFSSVATASIKDWGRDTYAGEYGKEQGLWGPGVHQSKDATTVDSHFYATTRDKFIDPDRREQRQAAHGEPDLLWSLEAVLGGSAIHDSPYTYPVHISDRYIF